MSGRGRRVTVVAAAVVALGACTDGPGPDPPASPPLVTSSSAAEAATGAPIAPLVGAWSRSLRDSEVAYRFLADGRYRSVAIIGYAVPGDEFEMRMVQDGTAEVAGDRVALRPTKAVVSRTSSKDPAGDYTDRPTTPTPETYTWRISGDTLTLTGQDGRVVALTRQS